MRVKLLELEINCLFGKIVIVYIDLVWFLRGNNFFFVLRFYILRVLLEVVEIICLLFGVIVIVFIFLLWFLNVKIVFLLLRF